MSVLSGDLGSRPHWGADSRPVLSEGCMPPPPPSHRHPALSCVLWRKCLLSGSRPLTSGAPVNTGRTYSQDPVRDQRPAPRLLVSHCQASGQYQAECRGATGLETGCPHPQPAATPHHCWVWDWGHGKGLGREQGLDVLGEVGSWRVGVFLMRGTEQGSMQTSEDPAGS